MFRTLAVTVAAAALTACATDPPQPPDVLVGESLAGKRIAVSAAPPPPLRAGAVGEELSVTHAIADPAARIGRGVALRLVAERGMTLLLDQGAEAVADYVIDVQTRDWSLDTYPLSRKHYRLKYAARLRLIDRADGRVLAESSCRSEQGDSDHPPTRDELIANGAALVRGYLEMATATCVDLAVRESLRLGEAAAPALAATGAVSGRAPGPVAVSAAQPPPVISAVPEQTAAVRRAGAESAPRRDPPRDAAAQEAAAAGRALAQPAAVKPPPARVAPTPQPAVRLPPAAAPDAHRTDQDNLLRRDVLSEAARASGQVILVLEDTPFRDGPRRMAPVTRMLAAGTEIVVRQRIYNAEGEWWFVVVPGDVGWIPSPDPQALR